MKKFLPLCGLLLLLGGICVLMFLPSPKYLLQGKNQTFKNGRKFAELADRGAYDNSQDHARHRTGRMEGEGGGVGLSVTETNTEDYTDYGVNKRTNTQEDSLSTFAIDVDTASYTIARRKINEGSVPPKASIRVEEFINYFLPEYDKNRDEWFRVYMDAAPSPFRPAYHLLRVVVQGEDIVPEKRKPANLVFLVDTSGSMNSEDKIGLLKRSLALLTESLSPQDHVAICTYAGSVKIVLPSTNISEKHKILNALERLESSGSTAMESGILNAYSLANVNFQAGAINRVIVCSDGDANVGRTSHKDILKLIADYKEKGITLSTIGFGMGNYKDTMMEQLANQGNGNYAYIDNFSEAKRVFSEQLTGTLQVIAKDVKIQVDFNKEVVENFRLVGYENRKLRHEDFRNDQVDGGEIGSGHTVTALYEVKWNNNTGNLCKVSIRGKEADGSTAEEFSTSFHSKEIPATWEKSSKKFRFIACVAEFAEVLRESDYAKDTRIEDVLNKLDKEELATDEREHDFVKLVRKVITTKG